MGEDHVVPLGGNLVTGDIAKGLSTPVAKAERLLEIAVIVTGPDLTPRIEIEEELRLKAKKSLDAMLTMASASVGQGDLGPVR